MNVACSADMYTVSLRPRPGCHDAFIAHRAGKCQNQGESANSISTLRPADIENTVSKPE